MHSTDQKAKVPFFKKRVKQTRNLNTFVFLVLLLLSVQFVEGLRCDGNQENHPAIMNKAWIERDSEEAI